MYMQGICHLKQIWDIHHRIGQTELMSDEILITYLNESSNTHMAYHSVTYFGLHFHLINRFIYQICYRY
jgi:hypothetical protein